MQKLNSLYYFSVFDYCRKVLYLQKIVDMVVNGRYQWRSSSAIYQIICIMIDRLIFVSCNPINT